MSRGEWVHGKCKTCGSETYSLPFRCDACGHEEVRQFPSGDAPNAYFAAPPSGWLVVADASHLGFGWVAPMYCSWTCLAGVATGNVGKEGGK